VRSSGKLYKRFHPLFVVSLCIPVLMRAQCPSNIDFEKGNFDGWTCYIGNTAAVNNENQISLSNSGPVAGRHTMYAANSGLLDPYGNFPVNCPNGSGHSIRLGNDLGGGEAEGISYEFVIPADRNVYSLMYYYAVVFQDPNHQEFQQPRMVVEITNVTDGELISCSSFTFIPYGSVLPGFFISPISGDDGTPVWCKDWSAVTINLNGHAGKTIRLFFKTADCTFRRHFGYAYIDVNSECSDEFVGASYCPDDTAVNVVGPYGYQDYTWYNNDFSQVLGKQQTLVVSPPPPAGTSIALQIVPYSGYGCLDTLYARLIDTLKVRANAGADRLSCNDATVQIGAPPKMGFVYSWSPVEGLSNPNISNPLAQPDKTTAYILTSQSVGGGCRTTDTVVVTASSVRNKMDLLGKETFCEGFGDSAVLVVDPADSIQWFRDGIPIKDATRNKLKVTQSGSYHAVLLSAEGCIIQTKDQPVLVDKARTGVTYPTEYAVINLPYVLEARDFGNEYLWNPGIKLDDPTKMSPTFKGVSDQLYTIDIKTNTGCITVDTQMVKVIKGAEIFVPSAFTPNSDGLNDVLRPTLMGMKELQFFRVYNRWGQLLFETRTKFVGWDGRVKGTLQAAGVVVWVAQGTGTDGRVYLRRGTSVLIR
jgi:gliding motility-associated-like protein